MFALALNNEARSDYESLRASILSTIVGGLKTMKKVSKYELVVQAMPTDPRFIDRTGQRFGRLVVLSYAGRDTNPDVARAKHHRWNCACACGEITSVTGDSLVTGHSRSCGCLRSELVAAKNTTHGESRNYLYVIYYGIRDRCLNPANSHYSEYGGRGILVDPRFSTYEKFSSWVRKNLGERPSEIHSIDRINNNGDYTPKNLRWATPAEQALNTGRTIVIGEYQGAPTLHSAAISAGLPPKLVYLRVRNGWSIQRALTTDKGEGYRKNARLFNLNGRIVDAATLVRETGIDRGTFFARLSRGWSVTEALSTPANKPRGVTPIPTAP